ncbi:MAG: hypothetical protein FWD63_04565 [Propionibacteriaceae bacterium]|nr:hypothetical protein [Propionibacteriaceae bacterium]
MKLEIAVQDVAGALVAKANGADRVELCSALAATGGITPSAALIESVVDAGLPVHVLLRCRPGPFVYDAQEIAVMTRDATWAIEHGAAGVVFGALTEGSLIDERAMAAVRDAAAGNISCHRAMDVVINAGGASAGIQALVRLGIGRVLTSGGAKRSIDGAPMLAHLAALADGRLEIMAGGGVHPSDIAALAGVGVGAVHLSARSAINSGLSTGPGGGDDETVDVTDPAIVQAAAEAVAAACA